MSPKLWLLAFIGGTVGWFSRAASGEWALITGYIIGILVGGLVWTNININRPNEK